MSTTIFEQRLSILDFLQKSKGKYINRNNMAFSKSNYLTLILCEFDLKEQRFSNHFSGNLDTLLICPLSVNEKNLGKEEIHFDIKPFMGIVEIEKEKYPFVHTSLGSFRIEAKSIKHLLIEINKQYFANHPNIYHRFIGYIKIEENDEMLEDIEIVSIEKEHYYIR